MRKLLLFALLFGLALTAYAQEPANPLPDLRDAGTKAILALTPIVGVFVLWGFKALWTKIPASFVLFAGPLVGIAINYALSYLIGHTPLDPLLAAAFGALATWLREIASTLQTKGLIGSITPTKLGL